MSRTTRTVVVLLCAMGLMILWAGGALAAESSVDTAPFPRGLDSYGDDGVGSILAILQNRIAKEPFNLVATLIFFLAIIHTFLASRFMSLSHKWEHEHEERIERREASRDSHHLGSRVFHFLGEVEAIFGIWAVVLVVAIIGFYDWTTIVDYIDHGVNFTEPAFVVVIMTLAATRPILRLVESIIKRIASVFGSSLAALWFTTLTIGPVLGSFITEPAAMTICALVLARNFYELEPSNRFKYGTLGLLFVNISVGGTLTNFSAPPVLMVAAPWEWSTSFMLTHFGWKAVLGILVSNSSYFLLFRKEIAKLEENYALVNLKNVIREKYLERRAMDDRFDRIAAEFDEEELPFRNFEKQIQKLLLDIRKRLEASYVPTLLEKGIDKHLIAQAFTARFEEIKLRAIRRFFPGLLPRKQRGEFTDPDWDSRDDPVPSWVTMAHVLFMAWTIVNSHHPQMFIVGMLFFLGFAEVTKEYQNRINLKSPMLVGFFLAGLVIHGGVQGWWIAPILGSLAEVPLMLGATVLTAFNDNAAITYLATLVPNFTDSLKYVVVAGAVAGGGLTIIANAPNPAGVALLKKYFDGSVSAVGLLASSLLPTLLMFLTFLWIR